MARAAPAHSAEQPILVTLTTPETALTVKQNRAGSPRCCSAEMIVGRRGEGGVEGGERLVDLGFADHERRHEAHDVAVGAARHQHEMRFLQGNAS